MLEDLELENCQDSKYKGKRSTSNQSCCNNSMLGSQPIDSVSSEDDIMKKMEEAKKLVQKMAEINAAIRSLKTNLILSLILMMTVLLLPFLNPMFSNLMVSLMKGFVPILTTILNFSKIQNLIVSSWNNLF